MRAVLALAETFRPEPGSRLKDFLARLAARGRGRRALPEERRLELSRKLDHVQATDATRLIPGLGPKSTAWLAEVGIDTPEVLREMGAVAAYLRLKHWNPRLVTLNALWGLHAALAGIPWTAIDASTKERLLAEVRAAKHGRSRHRQPCT
jgi:hypothetical protein